MKKIVFILSLLAVAVACKKEKETKGYAIIADTLGFEDGTQVYVNSISQSNRPVIIDSTTIKDGKFELELSSFAKHDLNYLTFKNLAGNVLFVAEDTPIHMTVYKDSLRSSIIEGGTENKLFIDYLTKMSQYNKDKQKLRNEYHVATRLNKTEEATAALNEQKAIEAKEKEQRNTFAEKYPNSLVSVMALTDLMNLKIIPAKKAKTIFTTFNDSLKVSRLGKNLHRIIAASIGKIDIGSEAENFTAPTPDGKTLSLKEAMGKITIIDFWASWCKPCRAENPNVVRVYKKYHDKGLNIIGVSLDRNKDHWIKAIDADQLEWSHVSNLKFWQDPIARSYGVRSIPATFIIDETGNVIAKNLRGPALENKVAELLAEKTL